MEAVQLQSRRRVDVIHRDLVQRLQLSSINELQFFLG